MQYMMQKLCVEIKSWLNLHEPVKSPDSDCAEKLVFSIK